MTLSPTAICLMVVVTIGFLATVSIGTWVYYANEAK